MAENSVYVVTEIVGTSTNSWEDATEQAIRTATKSLQDLRIGEVAKQDVTIENGTITSYRVRLTMSFRYHPWWNSV
jgi:dodecin